MACTLVSASACWRNSDWRSLSGAGAPSAGAPGFDGVGGPSAETTVILRPENDGTGLRLTSVGAGFGDAGFYRLQRSGDGVRIWRVAHLHDTMHLYVDQEGCVRCDHRIRFLGVAVMTLHYRMRAHGTS